MANLDYFRASSLGGRPAQNHWSGDSGCAEQFNHIATAPQFVSRISSAHFSGFCHAAAPAICVTKKVGEHLHHSLEVFVRGLQGGRHHLIFGCETPPR